jgi:hypothetical protein
MARPASTCATTLLSLLILYITEMTWGNRWFALAISFHSSCGSVSISHSLCTNYGQGAVAAFCMDHVVGSGEIVFLLENKGVKRRGMRGWVLANSALIPIWFHHSFCPDVAFAGLLWECCLQAYWRGSYGRVWSYKGMPYSVLWASIPFILFCEFYCSGFKEAVRTQCELNVKWRLETRMLNVGCTPY